MVYHAFKNIINFYNLKKNLLRKAKTTWFFYYTVKTCNIIYEAFVFKKIRLY